MTTPESPVMTMQDIVKTYDGVPALEVPRLDIYAGQNVGIVGNNGAGKTTFLRILLDLIEPDAGVASIDGEPVAKSDRWRGFTCSYLEESQLVDFLKPHEFLSFVAAAYGIEESTFTARLDAMPDFIDDSILRGKKYIRELSLGNKKKVGIVAALLVEPRVLMLDEPYANLDPSSRIVLNEWLLQLQAAGTTMLISSHDLNDVVDVSQRILVMVEGAIVEDKTSFSVEELESVFLKKVLDPMGPTSSEINTP